MSFLVSYNPKIPNFLFCHFGLDPLPPPPLSYTTSNIHQMYSTVFIGPSHMGEHPTGFSQPPPLSCSISASFVKGPLPYVHLPSFSITAHQTSSKGYKISIGPDEPPHSLFFHFKQNFLFGDFSPLAGTPSKDTSSFNRP